jgi:hypothetical protein
VNPEYPEELDRRDLTSYGEAQQLVHDFEGVLKGCGLIIQQGSLLENVCLSILDFQDKYRGVTPLNLRDDIRPVYSNALGLIDIVKRVNLLCSHRDFQNLVPHLRLMNTSSVAQNVRAIGDDGSNKLFELFMALVNLDIGKDVLIDDPGCATGRNPDVLSTFDGVCWGFACKVLNSVNFSPLSMFDNLKKGIDQIQNSPAEVGCVVFNFKNVIDHDVMWPITNPEEVRAGGEPKFAAWGEKEQPVQLLVGRAGEWHKQFEEMNTLPEIEKLFAGKKAIPAVFAFLQTTTAIRTSRGPLPTLIGVFVVMDLLRQNILETRVNCRSVLNGLNDAMHHRQPG